MTTWTRVTIAVLILAAATPTANATPPRWFDWSIQVMSFPESAGAGRLMQRINPLLYTDALHIFPRPLRSWYCRYRWRLDSVDGDAALAFEAVTVECDRDDAWTSVEARAYVSTATVTSAHLRVGNASDEHAYEEIFVLATRRQDD